VSVVVSSYNYERFLPQAIDSALNQTYPHTEVIVVDDGSADGSREIIASYGSRIIPVLKDNGGQASALNAGFRASRGQAILFLDSDDALLPTAVESAVPFFDDPGVVKVHWQLREMHADGLQTGGLVPSALPDEGDWRGAVVRDGPYAYTWPDTTGSAWSRWFLEKIFPIPEAEYQTCPDLYLSALAPLYGCMRRVSQPQGYWRNHDGNHSCRVTFEERLKVGLQRDDHCLRVLEKQCEAMGLNGDRLRWKANSWWHRLDLAAKEAFTVIPPGETFILVDEDQWGTDPFIANRRRLHFLGRNGQYSGLPPVDEIAIEELDRLRQSGAGFIVFAWQAFWALDYYPELNRLLRSKFRCVLESERVVIFDLRAQSQAVSCTSPTDMRGAPAYGANG
jgi:glycosyltransferase involved in cell wall biosynthesis